MNWLNKHLSFKADVLVTLLNGLVVIGGVIVLIAAVVVGKKLLCKK